MQGSTRKPTLDSKDETAGEKESTGFDSRALFPGFGPGTGPQADRLLQRKPGGTAACAGQIMTNHAGLVGAEHVLTTRANTNRSRRHEISDQRLAQNIVNGPPHRKAALD